MFPWRKVVSSRMLDEFSQKRGTISRMWELTLECGHVEKRKVLFKDPEGLPEWAPRYKSVFQNRPDSEASPAPVKIRCSACKA